MAKKKFYSSEREYDQHVSLPSQRFTKAEKQTTNLTRLPVEKRLQLTLCWCSWKHPQWFSSSLAAAASYAADTVCGSGRRRPKTGSWTTRESPHFRAYKKTPWLLPGGTDLKVAVGVLKQCVEVWIATAVSSLVILVFEQLAVSAGEPVACLAEKLQWLLFVDVAEDGLLGGKAYCFWKTGQDRNCRGNSQEFFAIITICFSLVKMYDFLCSCEACYRSFRYRIIFFPPLFDPASFSGLKPQYSLT